MGQVATRLANRIGDSRKKDFPGLLSFGVCAVVALAGAAAFGQIEGSETTRVSVSSQGVEGDQESGGIGKRCISSNGRLVVFGSGATNLVAGDTNEQGDIFVHDRKTGLTTRVSVGSQGTEADFGSWDPAISADGRFVTFESGASNLVPGDTNEYLDVFVHDRETGVTTRVNVSSDGTQSDRLSHSGMLSGDGRYVVFYSQATNLVPNDTNDVEDVFLHDLMTGETTRVSVSSTGTEGNSVSFQPTISSDGRFIAFTTWAFNLISGGDSNHPGRDILVQARETGETTLVSVNSDGVQGNRDSFHPSLSADGRYIAFISKASNLVSDDTNGVDDVFVHDVHTGRTVRASISSDGFQSNGHCEELSISGDGRFVAFSSRATNLVPNDTNDEPDVFVHDLYTGMTVRASTNSVGGEAEASSDSPSISTDGNWVVFSSTAANLVSDDTNDKRDIFVHRLLPPGLYFAQFGDGGGALFSQIMLANLDEAEPANASITLRDPGGQPLSVDLNGNEVAGELEQLVPPKGLFLAETDGIGDIRAGSVTVTSDRPLAGVILFGGAIGLAGVGSSLPMRGGFVAPMENNEADKIRVGIAIMNLEPSPLSAMLELYAADGSLLATIPDFPIAGLGREAKFLDELYPGAQFSNLSLADFQGLLKVTSAGSVAATVIQTRPGEFATMPVAPIEGGSKELFFAQFGDGQGALFSQIMLFNLESDQGATADVLLRDPAGQPLTVDLDGETVAGELEIEIPAGGLRVLRTDGEGDLAAGSVRVTADQPLAGVILFGGTLGVAGVGNSVPLQNGFVAAMENREASRIRVGIAIMNLQDLPVTAVLELLDEEGMLVATHPALQIAAMGREAKFLDELFPETDLSDFKGVLSVTATGVVGATVIQTRPGQFATIPVAPK